MVSYNPVPDEVIVALLDQKFKTRYSAKLGHQVFVLKQFLPKPVFERHKRLFGHTDIGWTVKYPKHLIRVLVIEGIWSVKHQE